MRVREDMSGGDGRGTCLHSINGRSPAWWVERTSRVKVKMSVGQQLPSPGPQGISHVPEPPISPGMFCRCRRKMRSSAPGNAGRGHRTEVSGIRAASS